MLELQTHKLQLHCMWTMNTTPLNDHRQLLHDHLCNEVIGTLDETRIAALELPELSRWISQVDKRCNDLQTQLKQALEVVLRDRQHDIELFKHLETQANGARGLVDRLSSSVTDPQERLKHANVLM